MKQFEETARLLGKRIWDLRKQAGLSQEELAEGADVSLDACGRLERGEGNATLKTMVGISEAFRISLSELFQLRQGKQDPIKKEIGEFSIFLSTKPLEDIKFAAQMTRQMILQLEDARSNS